MKILKISLLFFSMLTMVFASDYSVVNNTSVTSNRQQFESSNYQIEATIIPANKCDSRTSMYSIEGLILPGDISDLGPESEDAISAKLDDLLPDDYYLFQNYPNPFNGKTAISYSISDETNVIIEVYNILGQKVATLINEVKSAGDHSIIFDAKDLDSGIYFYRLTTENHTQSNSMVLLR
jgi:hypothetical protein